MNNYLIVVDMQNDFVDGALGTKEAVAIVPRVVGRVKNGLEEAEHVIFTRDTHQADYLNTQEGKNLPVPHCIGGSVGWEIIPQLTEYMEKCRVVDKPTFGSAELGKLLWSENRKETISRITLVGLCTDICVISNALLIKAFLPETKIIVEASCCAGVTDESHRNALAAMKCCQIEIAE